MPESRSAQLKRVAGIYDELAPTWDRRVGLLERWLVGTSFRKHLGSSLRGTVLEIGSGSGATIPYVTFGPDAVTSLVGTDLSLGMLNQIKRDRSEIQLSRMSADNLAFHDNTFDVVTCSLVLCTVPDPERALREMSRVCKSEGQIVLLEHVLAPNRFLAWMQRKLSPAQERQLGCHFDRATDKLLQHLGFEIISQRRRFFGIFVLCVTRPIGVGPGVATA